MSVIAATPAAALEPEDGTTTIRLDKNAATMFGFAKPQLSFQIAGFSGAQVEGLEGVLPHYGGLKLSAGRRSLVLAEPEFVLAKRSFVRVSVGKGAPLKAFTIDTGAAKVDEDVVHSRITGLKLGLSRAGAKALNAGLKTTAYKAGMAVGKATVDARDPGVDFVGGHSDLAFSAAAATALETAGIMVAPIGATTAGADGSFGLPVDSGVLLWEYPAGFVYHGESDGIELTRGATSLALTSFVGDYKRRRLNAIADGAEKSTILASLFTAAEDVHAGRTSLRVGPSDIKLTKAGSRLLNTTFATTAFKEGLVLGTLDLVGIAQ